MAMQFDCDPNTDSLCIKLAEAAGVDAAPGVIFDYDANGQVVGIDIEYASKITGVSSVLRKAWSRQPALAVAD